MTEIDFAYFNRHQRGGRVDRIYVTGELRKSEQYCPARRKTAAAAIT